MNDKSRVLGSERGFTLIEVMVTLAVIAILAAMGLPALLRYQHQGLALRCVANLRMLQNARECWANDNPMAATVSTEMSQLWPYTPLTANGVFTCPAGGGSYGWTSAQWSDLPIPPTCSNFDDDPHSYYYNHRLLTNVVE